MESTWENLVSLFLFYSEMYHSIEWVIFILLGQLLTISSLRKLQMDFLEGNTSRWKRILKEQNWQNRLTLGFIQPFVKKNQKEFVYYRNWYKGYCLSLIAQELLLILSFSVDSLYLLPVPLILSLATLIIAIVFRLPLLPLNKSRFAKRHK